MSPVAADLILKVEGLSKRYAGRPAVDGASFSVRRGEVLGVIGPNGAGKSTLLGCMGGILSSDAGRITRHECGDGPALFYLPDGIRPWPEQTVAWVLNFAKDYFRGTDAARASVIGQLGLEPLLKQPVGALSKGQRKRALLAVGLLAPHPVLMADEPFDGLDLRQTREVGRLLRSYAAAGRTLILSIHQIADAERVCDRFILLSGGRVCGEGTLAELTRASPPHALGGESPGLEEVFLALT